MSVGPATRTRSQPARPAIRQPRITQQSRPDSASADGAAAWEGRFRREVEAKRAPGAGALRRRVRAEATSEQILGHRQTAVTRVGSEPPPRSRPSRRAKPGLRAHAPAQLGLREEAIEGGAYLPGLVGVESGDVPHVRVMNEELAYPGGRPLSDRRCRPGRRRTLTVLSRSGRNIPVEYPAG